MESPRRATESPWFWAYLFGTAALIALALISPKYGRRQALIEREFQGRHRAAQNQAGQPPSVSLSSPEQTIISLRPLFFGLAAITIIAWIIHWRQHIFRQRHAIVADYMASGGRKPPEGLRGEATNP